MFWQVIVEQLTLSPLNHLLFMIYYGVVIESRFLFLFLSLEKSWKVVRVLVNSSAMLCEIGTPWNLVRDRIKKTYPTVQITAWTVSDQMSVQLHDYQLFTCSLCLLIFDSLCCESQFFPVVGWINYKYVPLHSRVILHSLVAFFW